MNRLSRVVLWILAVPFAAMGVLVFVSLNKEALAAERARAMTMPERQAILSHCVELSRSLKEDDFELVFQSNPRATGRPIPQELAALQPRRVKVYKKSVLIILHSTMDSGTSIDCKGLNTPSPAATLDLHEGGDSEPWASLVPPK